MAEYYLSDKTLSILMKRQKQEIMDITAADRNSIDMFNRGELSQGCSFRQLYKPKKYRISEYTFIVPSESGVSITCSLFTKGLLLNEDVGPRSLIIFFHSGMWMLGNMIQCRAICSNICNTTGNAVLAVDYRLAPQFKFPIPIEDCYNALVWASTGARYWRIDPGRIYVMGDCCGGTLAAGVSRLARDRKGPHIAGQILINPITDCRLRTDSMTKYMDCPTLTPRQLAFCIANYQRESKDILNPLFSPLLAVDHSRLPKTLIIASELDPLFDDSKLYADALTSADTPCRLLIRKNQMHGFLSYPSSDNWTETVLAVSDFVRGVNINSIEIRSSRERRKNKPALQLL